MIERIAFVFAIAFATAAAAQETDVGALDHFVRVIGDHFERDGDPLRFVGANVAVMHGQAHRDALSSTLDAVRLDGLRVVRVWALGERDASASDWARAYAFRVGDDGWIEESFVQLDRVLDEARARDLAVIVVLANRWGDYGGVPQYLRWAGDAFDATSPDGVARTELGTFFRSGAARALYLAHVERIVSRVNSISGIAYRDDPTIFAWELVNEISCERRDAPDLSAFVTATTRRIRMIDARHLVSAGHIGYATSAERRTWREIMALPAVDFADAHAYPTEHDRVRTLRELDAFVDDQAMLAHHVLHKPLVIGEMGFASGRRTLGRSRAALFDRLLDRVEHAGVDGALAWMYAPSTDRVGPHTILTDSTERDSRSVRAVLAEHAGHIDTSIVRPDWPAGDAPLWDASRTIAGTRRVTRSASDGHLTIAPDAFSEARFEWVGRYDGGAVSHLYGGGHGYVEYRFRAPRAVSASMTISMRASSELPGRGEGAHPDDGSIVSVSIDGRALGTIAVPPDDGIGRRVSLAVPAPVDLSAASVHVLRFEIADDDISHGLCLYGDATGLVPIDDTLAAELPGRIELSFTP